jgi:hypothetical protein
MVATRDTPRQRELLEEALEVASGPSGGTRDCYRQ